MFCKLFTKVKGRPEQEMSARPACLAPGSPHKESLTDKGVCSASAVSINNVIYSAPAFSLPVWHLQELLGRECLRDPVPKEQPNCSVSSGLPWRETVHKCSHTLAAGRDATFPAQTAAHGHLPTPPAPFPLTAWSLSCKGEHRLNYILPAHC